MKAERTITLQPTLRGKEGVSCRERMLREALKIPSSALRRKNARLPQQAPLLPLSQALILGVFEVHLHKKVKRKYECVATY
jgi:hypothetical protein